MKSSDFAWQVRLRIPSESRRYSTGTSMQGAHCSPPPLPFRLPSPKLLALGPQSIQLIQQVSKKLRPHACHPASGAWGVRTGLPPCVSKLTPLSFWALDDIMILISVTAGSTRLLGHHDALISCSGHYYVISHGVFSVFHLTGRRQLLTPISRAPVTWVPKYPATTRASANPASFPQANSIPPHLHLAVKRYRAIYLGPSLRNCGSPPLAWRRTSARTSYSGLYLARIVLHPTKEPPIDFKPISSTRKQDGERPIPTRLRYRSRSSTHIFTPFPFEDTSHLACLEHHVSLQQGSQFQSCLGDGSLQVCC
jgi:hypothetical protein